MKLNTGENIKNLRRERNITQEELSEVLGVSYQSVSRWENNTCYPDMELLPTIAGFFGVTVDKLLGVDESVEKAHMILTIARRKQVIPRFCSATGPRRERILKRTTRAASPRS